MILLFKMAIPLHQLLLQTAVLTVFCAVAIQSPRASVQTDTDPFLIPLRRESVPIRRQGRIVTYKTSYSGVVSLGYPAQEFRVVFDTGSGHVVVPSLGCGSEACIKHRRYDLRASRTAETINSDGKVLGPYDLAEEVTIAFGTGEITGQFAKERVCMALVNSSDLQRGCLDMNVIMAVQMSTNPFSSFTFDGIFGLGLQMLAVTDDFSFIDMLSRSSNSVASQFAVFLTEGEDGEESEIALGGYNSNRALDAVSWSPVVDADEGHWLVKILAVRVAGQTLPLCQDGTCKGVVDTGTSHIGIPIAAEESVSKMLTVDAEDYLDCRLASAPTLEFELEGGNITLSAQNYMRRLPLREGVDVGAVVVSANDSVSDPVFEPQSVDEHAVNVVRHCSPRTMPVDMPEPLGPNLFILGEPVLHRYYTVYDWVKLQVGFSVANSKRNTQALPDGKGTLPEDVQLLMQHGMRGSLALNPAEPQAACPEATIFVQLVFRCAPGVMC
jgi:hypothetical protein